MGGMFSHQDSTEGSAARGGVAKPPSPPPPYEVPGEQNSDDPLRSSRGQQQVHDEHDLLSLVERTNAMAKLEVCPCVFTYKEL